MYTSVFFAFSVVATVASQALYTLPERTPLTPGDELSRPRSTNSAIGSTGSGALFGQGIPAHEAGSVSGFTVAPGRLFPPAGFSGLQSSISSLNVAKGGPVYEDHLIPRAGEAPFTVTITKQETKTHTLRVPFTSDVWVTSVKMVHVPVTQLITERIYHPDSAGTVTSFVRITQTPISFATRTAEVSPTRTLVSVFTRFVTATLTVELWQPIVHKETTYEVITVPVLETQTLLQRLFRTTTVVKTVDVTSIFRPPALGEVRSGAGHKPKTHYN